MSINCKICKREFGKQITNSHLKTHNITTLQYKTEYGIDSLTSVEYKNHLTQLRLGKLNPNFGRKMSDDSKNLISTKKKGTVPWNKGIKIEDTSKHKQAANSREEKYNSGELVRKTTRCTQETKNKISESVTNYAKNNRRELQIRAYRAVETKKKNGFDLAFFRGKRHTENAKEKISISSKKSNQIKTNDADKHRELLIESANLTLLNTKVNLLHLKCDQCGTTFSCTKQYFTDSKFTKEKCKVCFPPLSNRSAKEIELFNFVKSLSPDAVNNYRFSNSRHELDIFVPSLNIGIEFNGLYWHSDSIIDKNRDLEKYEKVTNSGIRCIVIMEDEWDFKKEIVISRLTNLLQKQTKRIYARQCECRELSSNDAAKFCNEFHIQGAGRSNARFGLFNSGKLVSVMTFSNTNISRKIKEWEINRFCSLPSILVVGGASKLFNSFNRKYSPDKIITYADRRWSVGNLYKKLGFKFIANTSPGYWYFLPNEGKRIHRYSLRKNKSDDATLTEYQNRLNQGYLRIWDCGNSKWIWEKGQ